MTVAQRLKAYMDDTCRKYSAVAKKAGVAPKTFDAMINGRQNIDVEVLARVCKALDIPVSRVVDPLPCEDANAIKPHCAIR